MAVAVASRPETVLAALIAGAAAVAVALLAPPGGDSAAHLYRTELLRDGIGLWDNLWFSGHYPLASYSLLYYFPAALVGNVPLVVAAVVASGALFASISVAQWGEAARWPARIFAVLAAGPLFTGTYSYALGLAAALAALRLLQLDRPWLAVVGAGLALGFSPLAFVFLCVGLGAVALSHRRLGSRAAVVGAGLALLAGLQLAVIAAFPSEGRYPFSAYSLAAVLTVSALGATLAFRADRTGVMAPFFVLWATVNLIAFLVPSPFGDNLSRLRALVFPLVLLTAVLARFRPRWLAIVALAVALGFNLGPDVSALPKRVGDARTAERAYWAPVLSFLSEHSTPNHRVEVVPTFGHWEAYWIPREGYSLARGWYRQIDLADNPELYRDPLGPQTYRAWLRRMGVRYVLLPKARLGPHGAGREAQLLRSGTAGLEPVFRSRDWTVYELAEATPILTGPRTAAVDLLDHERIAGRTTSAGEYRLRVRYTRFWRVVTGDICLARAPDGMTTLVVRRPGRFELSVGGGGARC